MNTQNDRASNNATHNAASNATSSATSSATRATRPTRFFTLIAPLVACLACATVLMAPDTAAAAAATQGSGTTAIETRSVAEFQAVGLSGSMDLVLRQGPQSVQVEADNNLLPLLETVVENRSGSGATLLVRWKQGERIDTRAKVLVTVSVPKLSAIASSGAGDIRLEAFDTPALKVSLSGSGDLRVSGLSTADLSIGISGSSDVAGDGKATKLALSIAGSGDVRLADLRADDVRVRIAGSGDAAVNAQKTLDVGIAGSGDVTYTGAAAVKSAVAGSGSIRKK